jgi:hypothetical protein
MRARPDEVEILNILGSIVRPEPGRLGEDRFKGERRTLVTVERGFEIGGVKTRSVAM